jgi:DNA-binding response OmpR family regulator
LEAGGFTVIPSQLASEALSLLDERGTELSGLVTDIRLPGGANGWEIARHARELRADMPVVYTTADSADEWPAQGVPKSVVVQKPYAGAQLLTAISSLITKADTDRTG